MAANASAAVPRILLTLREAAESIGISERKMAQLTASGEVPVVKIGRSARIRPSDLEALAERLLSGRQAADSES